MVLLAGVYFNPNPFVLQTTYFSLVWRVEHSLNTMVGKWGSCEMETDQVIYGGSTQNRYDLTVQFTATA